MVAGNSHMVLRRPLDALKIKNYGAFTPTELIDVQAAADILTHGIMPIVRMTRPAAWPVLCATLAEWMVHFERTRAGVRCMENPCPRRHEQLYKENLLGVCLLMHIRWAREVWVRAHFVRLCRQFRVRTAEDLASALRAGTGTENSIAYVGLSFRVKRP